MSHIVSIYGTKNDETTTLATEGYVKLANGSYKKMDGLTPVIRIHEDGREWDVVYKKDGEEFDKLYKKAGKLMRQLPKLDLATYLLTEDDATLSLFLTNDDDNDTSNGYTKLSSDADCYSVRNGEIVDRSGSPVSGDFEIVKVDGDGDLLINKPSEKFYNKEENAGFYEAVTIEGETNEAFATSFKIDPATEKKAMALAKKFAKDVEALGLGLVRYGDQLVFLKLPTDIGFPVEGSFNYDKKYISIPKTAYLDSEITMMRSPCIIIGDAENTDDGDNDND
jgi:hypothetical protein